MTVTATGLFKQPQRLTYLLAASATWRSLCGVSTSAAALQYIKVDKANPADETTPHYPRAICGWMDPDHFGTRKVTRDDWSMSGNLTMSLELEVPTEYPVRSEDAHNWFMNQVGAIISEMQVLAGGGEPVSGETHLNVTEFARNDGPWEYADDEVEVLDPDNYRQLHVFWIVFSVAYQG
jgi:hypothetical protein